jgi:dolichyl-phosphate beta-glucosyltransferase
MEKIFLSIVIPCYNEKENIERGVLFEVDNYLKTKKFSWEVIISDDESTDGSWDLVEEFIQQKKNYCHLKNKHGGKPSAVRSGIEKATGDWVLFTDMDQATPIDQLDKLLPLFEKYDVVIGSRGVLRKNFPIYRKLASFMFLNFRRTLLLRGIKDTQCGFKAFRREVAMRLFPMLEFFHRKNTISGWRVSAYDVELLFLSEKNGYKIVEVPVVWEDTDISRGKQRSFIKESKEMLFEIIRVRLNDLKGEYHT